MLETVLMLDERGDLKSLYTDLIPLRELGTLNVRRASQVEFDNQRQGWAVEFPRSITGGARAYLCSCRCACTRQYANHRPAIFASREDALAAEVAYLQARL